MSDYTFEINSPKYGIKTVWIDLEDYDKIKEYKWYVKKDYYSGCFYVSSHDLTTKNKKSIRLHRIVMDAKSDQIIDHVNHDTLDNRKQNLRFCSHQENMRNKGKLKNTSSKYKGVSFHKRDKIYTAHITIDKKLIHLGTFKNEIQAAMAYDEAAVKYFGEYANLNIEFL